MKRVLMIVALVVLAACGADDDGPTPVRSDPASDPALERIRQLDDCTLLQVEFDTADANGNVTFMRAADARMQSLGCYG